MVGAHQLQNGAAPVGKAGVAKYRHVIFRGVIVGVQVKSLQCRVLVFISTAVASTIIPA